MTKTTNSPRSHNSLTVHTTSSLSGQRMIASTSSEKDLRAQVAALKEQLAAKTTECDNVAEALHAQVADLKDQLAVKTAECNNLAAQIGTMVAELAAKSVELGRLE